jgi:hypothetical protein
MEPVIVLLPGNATGAAGAAGAVGSEAAGAGLFDGLGDPQATANASANTAIPARTRMSILLSPGINRLQ